MSMKIYKHGVPDTYICDPSGKKGLSGGPPSKYFFLHKLVNILLNDIFINFISSLYIHFVKNRIISGGIVILMM